MSGKNIRKSKLFNNNNAVIVAVDHGSYMGPFKGIENLPEQINQFKKADAVLVMPGMAKQCSDFFSQRNAPLCIIRVNWASHYCKQYLDIFKEGYNVKIHSVRYAVSIGADLVMASLLIGTDEKANTENITQFSQIAEEADEMGIPLIGEYIPAGGIDQYSGDISNLLLGTRACAEFGADIIKTVYIDKFEEIVSSTVIPTLALGGGVKDDPVQAFEIAEKAVKKGAKGIVFGRNVICAKKPELYLDCLVEIVKNGLSAKEAGEKYL